MKNTPFPKALVASLMAALSLAACTSTMQEEANSAAYDPVYPVSGMAGGAQNGAIYSPAASGLFASDRRASKVGDIITVQFVERFAASKSQTTSGERKQDYSVDLPNGLFSANTDTNMGYSSDRSFAGKGAAQQSNSLTGRFSVSVVRVLPGGLLEISGQKRLTLNQGNEYIRLTGVVRPEDISAGNVVESDRIANASIKYIGTGQTADTSRPGWLARALGAVDPM